MTQATRKLIGIIGAGHVGATTALEISRRQLGNVVLVDIMDGIPQGRALDMKQGSAVNGYDVEIAGVTDDYDAINGADLVVVTAGLPRKPGMSRSDLLEKNASIVGSVVDRVASVAPECTIIMVTNPLDVMSYLAFKKSGFPRNKVMGMAGVLDKSRFEAFLSMEVGCSIKDVRSMVLGGHGDTMVPVKRYASISGIPATELIEDARFDEIVDRTRKGGAEIVAHLKTGSAYFAPAASVAAMAESILCDERRILPVCAWCEGEFGLENVYCGVPTMLGANGIEKIVEVPLSDDEKALLHTSADHVREGQTYIDELLKKTSGEG